MRVGGFAKKLGTALGLGLAENIPGRDPLLDGFGLIAFASLFPIMSVLAYGQHTALRERHRTPRAVEKHLDQQSRTED